MYQSTCTNYLNHASNIHQPVPQHVINLYHKMCINHAPTYTKQPIMNLYHKQVHQPCTNLYLNLYHQRVHQPCTKYVPIIYQILVKYESSRFTIIINYTPHVCANSSTTCLNHVPNMYLNQKTSSISSSNSNL
jgi:hypothetical protein